MRFKVLFTAAGEEWRGVFAGGLGEELLVVLGFVVVGFFFFVIVVVLIV